MVVHHAKLARLELKLQAGEHFFVGFTFIYPKIYDRL
jgi:hypothetical protein